MTSSQQKQQRQQQADATTYLTKACHAATACSDFAAAILLLDQAIQETPTNHELYRLRSTFHLNRGDAREALSDAMACTKLKEIVGWQELGAAHLALGGAGHYRAAAAAYKKGLECGGGDKKELSLGVKVAVSLCEQAEGGGGGGGGVGGGRRRSKRRSDVSEAGV